MRKALLAAACFTLFASPIYAQVLNPVTPLDGGQPVGSGNPLHVTGTFSASLGAFVPSLSYATLTATASSSVSTALPTNTGTVAFQNQTSVAISCTLANGNTASATTNELIVPAGNTIFVGTTGYDHAACINQTGSASNVIIMAGGSGLGTGFGGGGSGSGGAVTLASGAVQPGAYQFGAIIDINNGTNTPYAGTGTTSLLGAIFGIYNIAGNPAPCKAAATWNASTGLTGTQPTACDGSAAPWADIGAVGGTIAGTFGTPPGAVPAVPVNAYPNLGTLALGSTFVKGTTAAMTGTAATQIIAAVASKVIYVTRIKCNNSSGTATLVQITDGSAGTVLDTLAAGATYGGEQGTGSTPLFWTTSGNGLFAQDVTTAASVICTASGYSG